MFFADLANGGGRLLYFVCMLGIALLAYQSDQKILQQKLQHLLGAVGLVLFLFHIIGGNVVGRGKDVSSLLDDLRQLADGGRLQREGGGGKAVDRVGAAIKADDDNGWLLVGTASERVYRVLTVDDDLILLQHSRVILRGNMQFSRVDKDQLVKRMPFILRCKVVVKIKEMKIDDARYGYFTV